MSPTSELQKLTSAVYTILSLGMDAVGVQMIALRYRKTMIILRLLLFYTSTLPLIPFALIFPRVHDYVERRADAMANWVDAAMSKRARLANANRIK